MSGLAATAAAQSLDLPVLQTFHALGSVKRRHQGAADTSPPERLRLEAVLARTVDRIIATCGDEVAELRQMGVAPDRASVVPCGVDVDRFRPGPPHPPGRTLLSIGRLVERKGVDDVIRALPRVPSATLLVAGGPPVDELAHDAEARRLQALAVDLGVADRVAFLGRVPHEGVPALLAGVDVVVCTPWYEPFGMVPLEAMACGVPVVASRVGGLQDSVLPGVTGEHVAARDPDELARVLTRLLDDGVRLAAYGAAAVHRARSAYSWATVAERTEAVYAELLTARGAAPLVHVTEVSG
jgi:glycosyltransferase involved in cell wall biosynthesis